MVFETLGSVNDLKIQENSGDGLMRLSGVFGVAGVKNANNRIYDRNNYGQMVECLQKQIKEAGCPGELEHPNSMNIDLHNVSHKIESIQMNEDGTITGTICLLNTPNGRTAQAIVEGGLPLYISSRGAGTITNEGKVTLSTIKTYDLVGTPGFSQAKLSLNKNQKFENLNESLSAENTNCWAIVTEAEEEPKEEPKAEPKVEDTKAEPKEEPKAEPKVEDTTVDDKNEKTKNNKDIEDKVTMDELKQSIDTLTDKVKELEAQLHIAQESLNNVKPTNYDAIEKWITEEFAPEFRSNITEDITESVTNKVINTVSNGVQTWVVEEFAPQIENWLTEEYTPEVKQNITESIVNTIGDGVEKWITEEYSPVVQNWIVEEYSPMIQNWITEEYSPVVDSWLNEELLPQNNAQISEAIDEKVEAIEKKVNENVSEFLESKKADRLEHIDSVLEQLENSNDTNTALNEIVKEQKDAARFSGVYCVEHMPVEYQASFQLLDESRQNEIIRSSRMYDFTKEGVLENFWANVDFDKKSEQQLNEGKVVDNSNNVINNYQSAIVNQMMRLRRQ